MTESKNITILLEADDIRRLQELQSRLRNTASGVIRYLLSNSGKILPENDAVASALPSPAPSAPAARHALNSSPLSDEELAALDRRECVSVKEEEEDY